jgi:glycosyltransferase involved in cell wall biosynthesis
MSDFYRPGVVSIIVPTCNHAHLVERTLDSVFAQTYRPIELIVVNDGSTDETTAVLESWATHHRGEGFEVRLILQINQGAQVARNRGLIECTGEYIQFLDSDDRILKQKLSAQVECLRETEADYCYAKTEGVDKYGTRSGVEGRPKLSGRPWIFERSWHTSSPLYMRHVSRSTGPWNESLRVWQDFEYSARIKAAELRGIFLDTVLCLSFEHDGPSITRQWSDVYVPAVFRAVDFMLPLVSVTGRQARIERNRLAQHLANLALIYARQGETDYPRRCISKASSISRGIVKLPITLVAWMCRLVPPRVVLELGWRIAGLLKNVGRILPLRMAVRRIPRLEIGR